MKQPLQPLGALRSYQAMLLAYVADMTQETKNTLPQLDGLEVGTAAWSARLTELMAALALWHADHVGRVINRLGSAFNAVNRFNDKDWQEIVRAGTGLKIVPSSAQLPSPPQVVLRNIPRPSRSVRATILGGARPPGPLPFLPPAMPSGVSSPIEISSRLGYRVDVYRSEPWLADLQANWVARNAALIKTIPQQYMAQVEALIRDAALKGLQPAELKKQIMELTGVSERRAKVIARDQMAKANAELTKYRQEDLGITEYTWLTSRDERVRGTPGGRYASARPSHYAREGGRFSWAKPPEGGHPGMAILCRCVALPVFPGE